MNFIEFLEAPTTSPAWGQKYKFLGFTELAMFYLIGGLEHGFLFFPYFWECHHPNWRTHIFFRGVGQPPTSYFTTNRSTSNMGGIYVNHMALIVWPLFLWAKKRVPIFQRALRFWFEPGELMPMLETPEMTVTWLRKSGLGVGGGAIITYSDGLWWFCSSSTLQLLLLWASKIRPLLLPYMCAYSSVPPNLQPRKKRKTPVFLSLQAQ